MTPPTGIITSAVRSVEPVIVVSDPATASADIEADRAGFPFYKKQRKENAVCPAPAEFHRDLQNNQDKYEPHAPCLQGSCPGGIFLHLFHP
jgi:hypothetical protein